MAPKSKKRSKKKVRSLRKGRRFDQPQNTESSLSVSSFEITDEPLENSSLPEEICDEMEDIFEKSQKRPKKIINRIEQLIEKYPDVPQLYNYASVAYSNLHDEEKAEYYVKKNYEKNPDYLFAKLNYAEFCMSRGDIEKIAEIFENKFDLKSLYPERSVFHITEVVGFFGVLAIYFAHIGMPEQTEIFYEILQEIAPKNYYTERVRGYLIVETVKKNLNRLIGKK